MVGNKFVFLLLSWQFLSLVSNSITLANASDSYNGKESGLYTVAQIKMGIKEMHPIPLQSVKVVASVFHAISQVEVTQVYLNKEEQPIEAIYYFPIDSNGAVTHFEAEVDGRRIQGAVKTSEEAKQEYSKAVMNHETAFLGEETKQDIFKISIGFLKPGSLAKILLKYVSEVKTEKGSNAIRFFIPTTVSPRYVPQRLNDEKSKDIKNMEFSTLSPAPISIKVSVSIQGEIKSVKSPTHEINITNTGAIPEKRSWTKSTVELSGTTTDMDRDFVLLIEPSETHKPLLYSEMSETSLAIMVHLIPSFVTNEQKAEFIFVLDRSGSMSGESINLAKKALTLFLHSLPVDCYFNIVGFGSWYELLFPKSVKYDDASFKKAVAHAQELYSNMGGTEILKPLKAIFAAETIPGYLRQIFVITDGEVGNTEEVIAIAKTNAHGSRVFSLGIGDGASHHLVEGIAEAGGGTSAFVTYNETVDKKTLQQLKHALQPSLTNVSISWEGLTTPTNEDKNPVNRNEKIMLGSRKPRESYHQAPENIPPIFDGSQLVILELFNNMTTIPTAVVLTADSPDGPLSIRIKISDANDCGKTDIIHKLAAVKLVRELELKVAALDFSYTDPGVKNQSEEEYKAEIIDIALKAGIASKYTSFVATDTSPIGEKQEYWAMQTRLVPSQIANGWYGSGRIRRKKMLHSKQLGMSYAGQQNVGMGFAASSGFAPSGGFAAPLLFASSGQSAWSASAASGSSFRREEEIMPKGTEKPEDVIHEIVKSQSFDGSFNWEDALIQAMGLDIVNAKQAGLRNGWDLKAWATALTVTFLSEKLPDHKDIWGLFALKASKWLNKTFSTEVDAMLAAAKLIFIPKIQ